MIYVLTCDEVNFLEVGPVFCEGIDRAGLLARRRRGGLTAAVGRMVGHGVDVNWHRIPIEFSLHKCFQFSRFFLFPLPRFVLFLFTGPVWSFYSC